MTQTILVTGGAGYIGSVVVGTLLELGHRVRVLDSLAHGSVPSLRHVWGRDDFEFQRGDVRDPDARSAALLDVEAVVHLAAIVGDPACARAPDLAREVNLTATRALLDDAANGGVRRFIFASTCSNYGRMADPSEYASENWDLRPVSLYAETKVTAELEVLGHAKNGFAPCCLRFATVYGVSPRMRFDLTVNEFVRDVAINGELVVFGEQFWRPYVHVRDAAAAIALVLQAPADDVRGAVFNVGMTSENYRKVDIVALLTERFPSATVKFVEKDDDPRDYRVSFEKINSRLGFVAGWSVPKGIDEVRGLLDSGLLEDPFADVYRN